MTQGTLLFAFISFRWWQLKPEEIETDEATVQVADMNENSSSATQSLPPQALPTLPNDEVENIASTILYCFLSLFVILGNVLVVAAFRFNRRLRTINNTFLVGLAVSDLLVGLISIPLWIYISSCQQLITCVIDQDLLTFYSTVDIFTGCASVLQLTAISIERYLAITRPINHRAYSMWIYYGMIMTAWSFAFIMAGLFPVQMNKWQKPYSIILFSGCFAVPALIIVTVYAIIFQAAKGTTRARVHPAGHGGNSAQSEAKIAATIAVITGLFIIAWLPFCIVNLFAEFWHHLLPPFPEILRLIRFVKWMHYSNSMVNPMVYAYRNGEMRKTFKRLLLTCFSCRGVGHRTIRAHASVRAHSRRNSDPSPSRRRTRNNRSNDTNSSKQRITPGRRLSLENRRIDSSNPSDSSFRNRPCLVPIQNKVERSLSPLTPKTSVQAVMGDWHDTSFQNYAASYHKHVRRISLRLSSSYFIKFSKPTLEEMYETQRGNIAAQTLGVMGRCVMTAFTIERFRLSVVKPRQR